MDGERGNRAGKIKARSYRFSEESIRVCAKGLLVEDRIEFYKKKKKKTTEKMSFVYYICVLLNLNTPAHTRLIITIGPI